jgi:hypothetical protein
LLSIPLLYCDIHVRLYNPHSYYDNGVPQHSALGRSLTAKLEFWRSRHIALVIRSCTIIGKRDESQSNWVSAFEDSLFLEFLPTLPKLQTLELAYVRICPGRAQALQKLTALTKLKLRLCDLSMENPSPVVLRVPHLVIFDQSDYEVLVETKTLQSLHFTHLVADTSVQAVTRCLAMPAECPQLESLTICTGSILGSQIFAAPTAAFHRLHTYKGSIHLVSLFEETSSILHLSLCYSSETEDMPRCLRRIAPRNRQLQSLDLHVRFLASGLLDAICEFPDLRSLEISHHYVPYDEHVTASNVGSVCHRIIPFIDQGFDQVIDISTLLDSMRLPSTIERVSFHLKHIARNAPNHQKHQNRLSELKNEYANLRCFDLQVSWSHDEGVDMFHTDLTI